MKGSQLYVSDYHQEVEAINLGEYRDSFDVVIGIMDK